MYLGIDLGTSSVKTILINDQQHVVDSSTATLDVSRPHDGWSEQDPASWITGIESTLLEIKRNQPEAMKAVKGIGLSGHMHGATLINKNDEVLRPCILWNDTRSHAEAAELDTDSSRDICGNILFPGFTSPKLAWVEKHEPEVFNQLGKVLLPKDYARLWLTGEYVSDMSDSAGTGWLDVAGRCWSDTQLAACNLSTEHMPSLVEGTAVSGTVRQTLAEQFGFSNTVVVAGSAGDNAASACGMGTVSPGNAFLSLGTSGVLFAANASYQPNAASAVHTFCHALPDTWHQMGVILAATDSLNWLSSTFGESPAELTSSLESESATPSDVLFLPYLGGERTPHNDANARGVFTGLSHVSDQNAMTKAVLQGVAFAFRDSQLALQSAGTNLDSDYAIGGGSQSEYWVQLIANALQLPLHLSVDGDFGASLGAARLGFIAAENSDPVAVCQAPQIAKTIEPDVALADAFGERYDKYVTTYQALKSVT